MNAIRKYTQYLIVLTLIIVTTVIWLAVYAEKPKNHVTISFLNIGQGDAIFIEATNHNTILLDGGPNSSVLLRELGKALPLGVRTIDVMIESHPDRDHIGGLPDVVSRYTVGAFLEPGVSSPNLVDDELHARIEKRNVPHFLARAGQIVDMGDGSYLKILFPDRDVSGYETNDASIVAQYWYGDTCVQLTGDSPSKMEDYLVGKYGSLLTCNVLKAGHHGSKNSTDDLYLDTVQPDVVVISAGKNNPYGHPNAQTIDRIKARNIKIMSTIEQGTITLESDGKTIIEKN